jgi:hypothetical protein
MHKRAADMEGGYASDTTCHALEPLRLADGSLLHTDGRIERKLDNKVVEVPTHSNAQKIVAHTQRTTC